ncbi:MAG: hypothetical protein JSU65_11040 [Candidatus Zixiibacteriota bacterium]|nr:MAG: hypothetical protein JSU65_11040 [candidate division Zixibacteria bacterium]
MLYFEVKDRLARLLEFRNLYSQYLGFTNRDNNVPAQLVREKMQPMTAEIVDSLRRVGMGGLVTRDAPVKGNRRVRINVIRAIFRDHVTRHYNLDDKEPLKVLDKGIIAYRRLKWRQAIQLVNPLFWVFNFIAFAARLPIHICRKAGYDTSHAESLTSVRLYIILFQFGAFYVLAKWTGLIDWLWIDIIAL